ncbi:L-arabinose transport system permease protein AraQ [Anaerolineae bacterium]|nr:L-arabinose transport system permease protein AraQ [Anaerolineae bacterium]
MAQQTLQQPAVFHSRLGKQEQERIGRYAAYVILIVGSIVMLLPFFWMVSTSLKPERGIFTMPPQWIPNPLIFDNYVNVWQRTDLARGMLNSTIIALITTAGEIFISTLAGFAFARMRFVGRNTFFGLLLITMMIPGVVTMIPTFILFRYLGWIKTWLPLIVPLLFGSAFAVFLSRQFFMTMPRELEDAAKVDGCNFFQIYWHIFLPNAKPIIATLFVLGFIARWNDFLGPLIYLQGATELYTVPLMLARLNSAYERQWALLMAGSMIALAPIILVFVFLQRYFVESVTMTGLKG